MSRQGFLAGLPLVLGGNVFGWTASGEEGFAVLDAFYEAGGRMIDTADVYSAWIDGHEGGESETVLGRWLSSRGVRKDMRIHTKTGMLSKATSTNSGDMGDPELYRPEQIEAHLDASLARLQTDYVDLYYAHRDFEELKVADIVDAFSLTVNSGKVRALGASNFSADRLTAALDHADSSGKTPFSALQNQYNLVSRDAYGADMQSLCISRGIAMLPFFGLAAGYLTGKYRKPEDFEKGDRTYRVKDYAEIGPPVLAAMDEVAAETGHRPRLACPPARYPRPPSPARAMWISWKRCWNLPDWTFRTIRYRALPMPCERLVRSH
jgi:aryl-alcohol dehydrogenase-like predicted oxidoreductase